MHRNLIDHSVSARVVSWNDAAEMNEVRRGDAFVIPGSGCAVAGCPPSPIRDTTRRVHDPVSYVAAAILDAPGRRASVMRGHRALERTPGK
jgi:hypothetical protein